MNWKPLLKITKNLFQVKKSYYWLSYDGIKKIITINPYDNLESEQMRKTKRDIFLLDILNVCVVMVACMQ